NRFDYFVHDSQMIGEPIKINLTCLLKSAQVLDGQICYDIKDANNIYEVYNARFRLHKQIYNHKTGEHIFNPFDSHISHIDALLLAEPYLKIASRMFDPKEFTYLTDDIMTQIDHDALTNPNLAPAAAIFDRIRTRDLYKSVDYKTVDWADHKFFVAEVTPPKIVRETHSDSPSGLTPDDDIVSFAPMHYGLLDENPLRHVKFYSKARPDVCAISQPDDYLSLVPSVFGEVLLRVYTKKAEQATGSPCKGDILNISQVLLQCAGCVPTSGFLNLEPGTWAYNSMIKFLDCESKTDHSEASGPFPRRLVLNRGDQQTKICKGNKCNNQSSCLP
ncbi:hypothetical protein F5146DRAFT_939889, partial [Armillaria mellea]